MADPQVLMPLAGDVEPLLASMRAGASVRAEVEAVTHGRKMGMGWITFTVAGFPPFRIHAKAAELLTELLNRAAGEDP